MPVYVVDSNFFIQAHRATYPLDVAISFWGKIKQLAETGKIISIDKVRHEIFDHQDRLKEWCESNLPRDFFKDTQSVLANYSRVVNWATARKPGYKPTALATFMDANVADAWLVAYALTDIENLVIVTQEKSEPYIVNKIKIPEACAPFQIAFVDTIQMLRQLGEQF